VHRVCNTTTYRINVQQYYYMINIINYVGTNRSEKKEKEIILRQWGYILGQLNVNNFFFFLRHDTCTVLRML